MPALQPCVLVALAVVAAAAHSAAAAQGTMRRTLTAPVHADECPASVDLEAPAQVRLRSGWGDAARCNNNVLTWA